MLDFAEASDKDKQILDGRESGAKRRMANILASISPKKLKEVSTTSVVSASRTPFLTCSRLLSRVDLKAAGMPAMPA